MIPKECKRLAEVDFPIAVVSKHSAREKSIRHGHPSTLHLWWARRPLAACRAMLMALLLPDPGDPLCPMDFKTKAKKALSKVPGWNTPRLNEQLKSDEGLRKALLAFIGDAANWDVANDPDWIGITRELVKAAHPDETPLVVDPFAGGGSIPLEALRLGCEAFASDLNPVACLILKVMLEDIPRHGPELAEELRRVGGEIKKQAEKELAEFYPTDPDGATPIAYLWARTVKCESPNCGAEIPLMRSFWLCKKANRKRALKHKVMRPSSGIPHVEFEIFEPKVDQEVHTGTVTRAKATCLCCGTVIPPERVRAQLADQRGGADAAFDMKGTRIGGARMLAVVALHPGIQGRGYRLPTGHDYCAVWKAQKRLTVILDQWERGDKKGLCPIPDEPLPPIGTLGFRVQRYGMLQWGDLFTARQKVALGAIISSASNSFVGLPPAVVHLMALSVGKTTDLGNAGAPWKPGAECPVHLFSGQKIPPLWDWSEAVLTADSSGSFFSAFDRTATTINNAFNYPYSPGLMAQGDATLPILPSVSTSIWFTDPPYYDAIPYSDLSDFFLVWLKRTLPGLSFLHDPFDKSNPLSPKAREAVQDETKYFEGKPKDRSFFEERMSVAFAEGRRVLREDGIGSVVFAHKTTEGWEALLTGLIRGGWTITGSWPIATEAGNRLRARDSAALATSVHLVCRPRVDVDVVQASSLQISNEAQAGSSNQGRQDAGATSTSNIGRQDACATSNIGDWGEVLRELPKRVGDWMERLQSEGIRGADLVFACIGPALEIFSRYRKVETADGREVKLAEYLEKVWEVVGRTALEQILGTTEARARNGMAGVLEEDARLTALFLWTLQATNGEGKSEKEKGKSEDIEEDEEVDDEDEEAAPKVKAKGYSLVFDVVRRFAQPLGIELPKWEGRIIVTKKGVVRLMAVSERAKQLFGEDGAAAADWISDGPIKPVQPWLFPELEQDRAPQIRSRKRGGVMRDLPAETASQAGATTLDRVHAAMLLQAGGQANALRMLIKAEQERGSEFMRLANALSALYPSGSEEKRLLDAMLLAVPR